MKVNTAAKELCMKRPHRMMTLKRGELLVKQSFDAYHCSEEGDRYSNTLARILNGDIVSDSESDNRDDYAEIVSLASAKAQQLIAKRRY